MIPVFGRSARACARAVLASIAKCWHLAASQGASPLSPKAKDGMRWSETERLPCGSLKKSCIA